MKLAGGWERMMAAIMGNVVGAIMENVVVAIIGNCCGNN